MTFNDFFEEFKQTILWKNMVATVEDSHWHREANTAVHTQMMLDWYMKNVFQHRSPQKQLFTMLAIVFHDVGKPVVEEEKHNIARGTYRSYANHEQHSAREFEHFMMANNEHYRKQLGLTLADVYAITTMIAHHLPYKYEKSAKRIGLKRTIQHALGSPCIDEFYDLLRADQHGRISDNGDTEKQEVEDWIKVFDALDTDTPSENKNAEKTVKIIVCDNTKQLQQFTDVHRSWYFFDAKSFADDQDVVRKAFTEFLKDKSHVVVIGRNSSAKARSKYVNVAKQLGFEVVMSIVQSANDKNSDKYWRVSYPMLVAEADEIEVVSI